MMGLDIGGVAALISPSGTTLAVNGASNWMSVNASGILSRPQTPYFRGQLVGKGGSYNGGGGPLLVTADDNFGNCWNNATGNWTCPIAGYYMVTGGGISNANSGYFYIQKNGADIHFTHWNHTGSWHYVPLSGIVSCAAGDTIRYILGSLGPGSNGFYGEGNYSMFSIALMV